MKYLKTVILENFQSHKYSLINFDEGLNVILGASDSGKTAIIRGIKWALYNEPSGDFFIREGESDTSVTLIFNDNTKLKRSRGKSKNSYTLYKKNGEEIIFEGFGTRVPDEIIEEIAIKKIKLDSESTNAINIAEQLEGSFLLSEKTSTRAGAIGRLIGVNIIDDALKETLKDIRNLSNNQKLTEIKISKLEEELKEYEYLADLRTRLERAETLKAIIDKKYDRRKKLESHYKKYKDLKNELTEINLQLAKLGNVEDADPLIEKIEKSISNFKYLNIKRAQYTKYKQDIDINTKLKISLANIYDIDDILENSKDILNSIKKYTDIGKKISIISDEKTIIDDVYNRLDKLNQVDRILSSFEEKPIEISRLTKLRDAYNLNKGNLKTGSEFVSRFDKIDESELIYKKINSISLKLIKLKEISNKIKGLDAASIAEKKGLQKVNKEIDIHLKKYKDLLVEIEICPFCLSNIDSKKIEHIINHYN